MAAAERLTVRAPAGALSRSRRAGARGTPRRYRSLRGRPCSRPCFTTSASGGFVALTVIGIVINYAVEFAEWAMAPWQRIDKT